MYLLAKGDRTSQFYLYNLALKYIFCCGMEGEAMCFGKPTYLKPIHRLAVYFAWHSLFTEVSMLKPQTAHKKSELAQQ